MRVLGMLCLGNFLLSCSAPGERFAAEAHELGFQATVFRGKEFSHAVFSKENAARGAILHVYLDGDGTPWINRRRVAKDPTPRDFLVLRLMRQDPTPALYLGRPCYHGFGQIPPCTPLIWTHERYSPRVVNSLAAALRNIMGRLAKHRLVLIGYSGGGTLAMLLAEHVPQTIAVITIASNMAVQAWTKHHGYSALIGSLDPFDRLPLRPSILQLHFAGAEDENVPPFLIEKSVRHQRDAEYIIYENLDHSCCWDKYWPEIMDIIRGKLREYQ